MKTRALLALGLTIAAGGFIATGSAYAQKKTTVHGPSKSDPVLAAKVTASGSEIIDLGAGLQVVSGKSFLYTVQITNLQSAAPKTVVNVTLPSILTVESVPNITTPDSTIINTNDHDMSGWSLTDNGNNSYTIAIDAVPPGVDVTIPFTVTAPIVLTNTTVNACADVSYIKQGNELVLVPLAQPCVPVTILPLPVADPVVNSFAAFDDGPVTFKLSAPQGSQVGSTKNISVLNNDVDSSGNTTKDVISLSGLQAGPFSPNAITVGNHTVAIADNGKSIKFTLGDQTGTFTFYYTSQGASGASVAKVTVIVTLT